ncbi:MAG: hypothetical protein L6R28_22975 [Planctomycetes bacterium]|nr:hypothetical protein [Planctomycetota bacterium]
MSREDLDALLDTGIKRAVELIEKFREFYPFAVAMDVGGGIGHVAAYNGEEFPPPKELRELLQKALAKNVEIGMYRATAIIYDAKITDTELGKKKDAIVVALEHRDEEPITCLLPYELKNGQLACGEILAQQGKRVVFK